MSHGLHITDLIAEVKRRINVPTNQSLFSTTDFEAFLNDELFTRIVPLVLRAREEFFVSSTDTSIAANTKTYKIPENSIGSKLRDVVFVDSNGNEEDMPRLSHEETVESYQVRNTSYGFKLQGNSIVLYPTPTSATGSVRFYYYRKPNILSTSKSYKITDVNTGSNQITLESIPSGWTTSTYIDVQESADYHDLTLENTQIQAISTNVVTLTSVSGVEVGDYACDTGYSAYPMIPAEGHRILAQAAAINCLQAIKDLDAMAIAEKKYEMMASDFLESISPRVDGAPKKIVNNSGVFHTSRYRTINNWS